TKLDGLAVDVVERDVRRELADAVLTGLEHLGVLANRLLLRLGEGWTDEESSKEDEQKKAHEWPRSGERARSATWKRIERFRTARQQPSRSDRLPGPMIGPTEQALDFPATRQVDWDRRARISFHSSATPRRLAHSAMYARSTRSPRIRSTPR